MVKLVIALMAEAKGAVPRRKAAMSLEQVVLENGPGRETTRVGHDSNRSDGSLLKIHAGVPVVRFHA
jgi:hypothetical protein